jgi:drug/metabolite transporter (DMT)-like permease
MNERERDILNHIDTLYRQQRRHSLFVLAIVVSSILVGAGRFCVPGHDLSPAGTYEAFAHIWVGSMLTASFLCWDRCAGKMAAVFLVLLTVLETVMFLCR